MNDKLRELVDKSYDLNRAAFYAYGSFLNSYRASLLKKIFRTGQINVEQLARSYGFTTPPRVKDGKFLKQKTQAKKQNQKVTVEDKTKTSPAKEAKSKVVLPDQKVRVQKKKKLIKKEKRSAWFDCFLYPLEIITCTLLKPLFIYLLWVSQEMKLSLAPPPMLLWKGKILLLGPLMILEGSSSKSKRTTNNQNHSKNDMGIHRHSWSNIKLPFLIRLFDSLIPNMELVQWRGSKSSREYWPSRPSMRDFKTT